MRFIFSFNLIPWSNLISTVGLEWNPKVTKADERPRDILHSLKASWGWRKRTREKKRGRTNFWVSNLHEFQEIFLHANRGGENDTNPKENSVQLKEKFCTTFNAQYDCINYWSYNRGTVFEAVVLLYFFVQVLYISVWHAHINRDSCTVERTVLYS